MKVEKFEHGEIHYRLPNIPEALNLLACMGVNKDGLKDTDQNELLILSKIIANMEPMITKVNCKLDGKVISDFETLCTDFRAITVLSKIAGELLNSITGGLDAKKK